MDYFASGFKLLNHLPRHFWPKKNGGPAAQASLGPKAEDIFLLARWDLSKTSPRLG